MTLLGDKPWLWVLIAGLFVLMYFLVILADNIIKGGNGIGQRFWKRHIVDYDPYPPICQTCNKDCKNCDEEV